MNEQTNAAALAPEVPPEAFLTDIAFGALLTQALYVAAKVGIADLLKDGARTVGELAAATETSEDALYRILRSLASRGIFTETAPKTFANTAYSEPLRADVAGSFRNGAIFMGESWHWNVWGNMLYSARTNRPAWGHTHGAEVFDYFPAHPEQAEIFNGAMTDMSVATAPAVVDAYDFSGIATLADIAGGHGHLLSQILRANPALEGVLFDLPHVVAGADRLLEAQGTAARVRKVAGDFFREVPAADAYIMKHIIHDWDDARAVAILENIHAAMKDGGKLLIVETVVPETDEPHYSKLLDLEMLVSPGGKERTPREYGELLAQAGFRLTRIIPTKSPFSIIEAAKA
ncbi:MAG TPA: methyltransferase [Pyrinomonadaceae bacterium]|jgi:hypothetical protein